jgi:Zn-dependent protease
VIGLLGELLAGNMGFMDVIVYIVSSLVVIFLTLPVHEYAHALIAVKLGDNTPRWQGRLSFDPFAHIDWLGALCILAFGFGWAKPVQINMNNFRNPKRDMALTALAGPVSNLLMALLSLVCNNACILLTGSANSQVMMYIGFFFFYVASINVSLAVFNFIPIPPLDGSRLLSALLPNRYYYKLMQYERIFFFALLGLLWIGALDIPLRFLTGLLMRGISFLASLPFRLIP